MVKEDRSTWKAKYTMRLTVGTIDRSLCDDNRNSMCSAIPSFFGNDENTLV